LNEGEGKFLLAQVFAVLTDTEKSLKMFLGLSERIRDQTVYETKSKSVFSICFQYQEV